MNKIMDVLCLVDSCQYCILCYCMSNMDNIIPSSIDCPKYIKASNFKQVQPIQKGSYIWR